MKGMANPLRRFKFSLLNCSKYYEATSNAAHKWITKKLNQIRDVAKMRNVTKLILLVNEAQHLLVSQDAYLFRCFRWWLRLKDHGMQIVAVFSGTTSRLANFSRESILHLASPPGQ